MSATVVGDEHRAQARSYNSCESSRKICRSALARDAFALLRTLLVGSCLLLTACSTPTVDRLAPAAPPLDAASDEAGLIMQMNRYEEDLANSAALLRYPALTRYLS